MNNRSRPGFAPWIRGLLAALLLPLASGAGATAPGSERPELLADYVPGAALVGSARMRVLFWDVYDANLFAPAGEWEPGRPFALSLDYLRELNGDAIADRSIEEIRRQGVADEATLARWRELIGDIIPDVDANTKLLGIADANQHAVFLRNGEPLGKIEDPAFTRAFFGIWLSEATSEPGLRRRLLGDQ